MDGLTREQPHDLVIEERTVVEVFLPTIEHRRYQIWRTQRSIAAIHCPTWATYPATASRVFAYLWCNVSFGVVVVVFVDVMCVCWMVARRARKKNVASNCTTAKRWKKRVSDNEMEKEMEKMRWKKRVKVYVKIRRLKYYVQHKEMKEERQQASNRRRRRRHVHHHRSQHT